MWVFTLIEILIDDLVKSEIIPIATNSIPFDGTPNFGNLNFCARSLAVFLAHKMSNFIKIFKIICAKKKKSISHRISPETIAGVIDDDVRNGMRSDERRPPVVHNAHGNAVVWQWNR